MTRGMGALIVIVGALFAWAVWFIAEHPRGSDQTVTVSSDALVEDAYPLYAGVTWGDPHAAENGGGWEVQSDPLTDITNIAEVSMPFTEYYRQKLITAGWALDMGREAGGPGAEISYYTKGDEFVMVAFRSLFKVTHPDAPSECPCDVQFTLMSGVDTVSSHDSIEARTFHSNRGFSIVLPTVLASSSDRALWSVDESYRYMARGEDSAIPGVKFTIPSAIAAGTNLSSDSYLSVEFLLKDATCDAAMFVSDPRARSREGYEGDALLSVASSTDAGAGNYYEEIVFARQIGVSCVGVRYMLHSIAIGNFDPGTVQEFDRSELLQRFDQIRKTIEFSQ